MTRDTHPCHCQVQALHPEYSTVGLEPVADQLAGPQVRILVPADSTAFTMVPAPCLCRHVETDPHARSCCMSNEHFYEFDSSN